MHNYYALKINMRLFSPILTRYIIGSRSYSCKHAFKPFNRDDKTQKRTSGPDRRTHLTHRMMFQTARRPHWVLFCVLIDKNTQNYVKMTAQYEDLLSIHVSPVLNELKSNENEELWENRMQIRFMCDSS